MAKRYYPLDALTKFTEDANFSSTGVIQRFGANVVLPIAPGNAEITLVVDVEAIKTTAGDERYQLILQGSNTDTFPAGDIENLGAIDMGAGAARIGGATKTSTPGRYTLDVSNQMGGEYKFARIFMAISGTGPQIKLSAYLSPR